MTRGFKFDATKLELATARLKQTKLNEVKQAWMLRRTKDRVIADQLPKKTDQVVFCALSPAQHKYEYNVYLFSRVVDQVLKINIKVKNTCSLYYFLPFSYKNV
jgi:SNF2 family DNA or RNA helicase